MALRRDIGCFRCTKSSSSRMRITYPQRGCFCTPFQTLGSMSRSYALCHSRLHSAPLLVSRRTFFSPTPCARAADVPAGDEDDDTFLIGEVDLHFQLLQEAHEKHGVLLNVPPQRPPANRTSPLICEAVPATVFPRQFIQRVESEGITWAYPPTYDPPPLHTAGTRSLRIETQSSTRRAGGPSSSLPTSSSDVVASSLRTSSRTEAIELRNPVDPCMRFHCTLCGKAFRTRATAGDHVRLHGDPTSGLAQISPGSKAEVRDGPGPGMLVSREEFVSPTTATKRAVPLRSTKEDMSSADGVKAPASTRPLGKAAIARKDRVVTTLPQDEEISKLLVDVWDHVAMQREDISKPPGVVEAWKQKVENRTASPSTSASLSQLMGTKASSSAAPAAVSLDSRDGSLFIPFVLVVEGQADKRGEATSAPIARATPEGAAPGLRTLAANVVKRASTARIIPIKELNAQYPNPFGDSANAMEVEVEKEPVNPFVDLENGPAPPPVTDPSSDVWLSWAQLQNSSAGDAADVFVEGWLTTPEAAPFLARPVLCPRCLSSRLEEVNASSSMVDCDAATPRQHMARLLQAALATTSHFRLLEALEEHVEVAHGDTAIMEGEHFWSLNGCSVARSSSERMKLRQHLSQAVTSLMGGPQFSSLVADGAASAGTSAGNDEASEVDRDANAAPGGKAIAPSLGDDEGEALPVHVRALNNTMLVGTVVDAQEGYLGSQHALQYVIRIPASTSCGVSTEEELIPVRCGGKLVPHSIYRATIFPGATVAVVGTLRLNLRVDAHSQKPHAYPCVHVCPPFGSITVLK